MLKLMKFLKPYTLIVVFILILMFAQAIAELFLPTLMSDVVNKGMMKGDTGYVLKYGIYMLMVAFGSAICSIFGNLLSSILGSGVGKDLRDSVFTKVESYSLKEFDTIGTASLITRATNDITQVQTVLIMAFRFMIYSPILCIGGIIMALEKDPKLTVILAIVMPLMIITIAIVALIALPSFKVQQKMVDKLNLVTRESLTGIRVVRAFGREPVERKRFGEANENLTNTAIRINKIMASAQPMMMLFMNVTSISIIWASSWFLAQNKMEIGNMMALIQYAMLIMFSIIMVSMMLIMIPRAQVSAVRINELLDMEPEINDPENSVSTSGKKGFVEFKNVAFRYAGAEQAVISNISFSAAPGETTAIIGGTGSGKSTLISLLPRFYDVESGNVLVDGVDVRDMTQKELRSKIGFVPQSIVLFSGTLAENIKYGKEDATLDEIKHAADVAQATDFITNISEGFDSHIAQGGTNLSGGQKQRLSIARALVRKPEIYIFDDSFSALDFKTDAKLRAALKTETKESTVIIVAQRVSTVMEADRIIVLDEGSIVGIGKHRELMKNCSVYKEIVSSQLSEEESA